MRPTTVCNSNIRLNNFFPCCAKNQIQLLSGSSLVRRYAALTRSSFFFHVPSQTFLDAPPFADWTAGKASSPIGWIRRACPSIGWRKGFLSPIGWCREGCSEQDAGSADGHHALHCSQSWTTDQPLEGDTDTVDSLLFLTTVQAAECRRHIVLQMPRSFQASWSCYWQISVAKIIQTVTLYISLETS